jgi:polar amino acid transport system substrate-binding protein
MRTSRFRGLFVVLFLTALVGTSCTHKTTSSTGASGSETQTLLDRIVADGQIRVATDPAYPPQPFFDEGSKTWEGFDIDVADEISKRLGLPKPVEWKTPSRDLITAGRWNDRWDVSIGSMTPTTERARILDFTDPYYYTPVGIAVKQGSDITSLDQLSGKKVAVCGRCTYESYLERNLSIPGYEFQYLVPQDVQIVTYASDATAIRELQIGRVDAVMAAVPTLQDAIDKGKPLQLLGDPVFYEPLALAVDKSGPLSDTTLVQKLDQIVSDMREDGTLTSISEKWYHTDMTTTPPPRSS